MPDLKKKRLMNAVCLGFYLISLLLQGDLGTVPIIFVHVCSDHLSRQNISRLLSKFMPSTEYGIADALYLAWAGFMQISYRHQHLSTAPSIAPALNLLLHTGGRIHLETCAA